MRYTSADLIYICREFRPLEEIFAGRDAAAVAALIAGGWLPQPSYRLDDGCGMFPPDYFDLVDDAGGAGRLKRSFHERYLAAAGDGGERVSDWDAYLEGAYGVCLKRVSPENIVRKAVLVRRLEALLEDAHPGDVEWASRLRTSTR